MFPQPIQKIISHFQKLPGIGPRQAAKFAMRLTKMTESELRIMAHDLGNLKTAVGECQECFLIFEKPNSNDSAQLCRFCRDIARDKQKICVVSSDNDALTIEKTKTFDGLYHVLGGHVSLLDKEENAELNLIALKKRIADKSKDVKEIILALNANAEGQGTALYLEKFLADSGIKITRLAQGLSTGSEIEYSDDQTLINALKHRR